MNLASCARRDATIPLDISSDFPRISTLQLLHILEIQRISRA